MKKMKNEAHDKKADVVPKLRFPEFRGSAGWEIKQLTQVASRVTQRNSTSIEVRVLSNSAVDGVVDQRDFFDKDIANKDNLGNYFVVEKGDFVYNPRISNSAPVGPISQNKIGRGVMSPLYTVFRFKHDTCGYYDQYFNTDRWYDYLKSVSNTGARHDRMAISNDAFMGMPIPYPEPIEQQRIADCLSSLDSLISAHTQKLDGLKVYKKGLMQQLFPAKGETVPKLRFPEFRGKGEWEEVEIGRIGNVSMCKRILKEQTSIDGNIPFYKIGTFGKQADAYINNETYEDYKTRFSYPQKGDILISAAGTIGRLVVFDGTPSYFQDSNIVWIENNEQIVSNQFLYHCYTMVVWSTDTNTIPRLYNDNLRRMKIFSTSKSEQQRIAAFLSSIDNLITAQAQKIESLKVHKKGLMQQLFPAMDEANA